MISHSEAAIAVPSKLIRRITKLPASKMLVALEKLKPTKFDETDVVLANKNLVYVLSADGQPLASQTARLLATRVTNQAGRLIFNQAFDALKGQEDKTTKQISGTKIIYSEAGFDEAKGQVGNTFFSSVDFEKRLKDLLLSYDQIFFCSDDYRSNAGLLALKPHNAGVVMLTRLRKTKKISIQNVKAIQPITVLFYA